MRHARTPACVPSILNAIKANASEAKLSSPLIAGTAHARRRLEIIVTGDAAQLHLTFKNNYGIVDMPYYKLVGGGLMTHYSGHLRGGMKLKATGVSPRNRTYLHHLPQVIRLTPTKLKL